MIADQSNASDVIIEPLTFKYLLPALKVVDAVFPRREQGRELADFAFTASLLSLGRLITKRMGYPTVNYWIARDTKTNQIYGTVGLYTHADDPEAYWGGWMCVDPRHRGRSIGKKLYEFALTEAKRKGDRPYFRFYTSTDPNEARAQEMYDRSGFKVYKEEFDPVSGYTRLYRQGRLLE